MDSASAGYAGRYWRHRPRVTATSNMFRKLALLVLLGITPDEAIGRYLTESRNRPRECSDWALAVQIDASLPKLKKHGSMSGLKVVSQMGQTVYRGLRFTGDSLVKTAAIARFLANDATPDREAGHRCNTPELFIHV